MRTAVSCTGTPRPSTAYCVQLTPRVAGMVLHTTQLAALQQPRRPVLCPWSSWPAAQAPHPSHTHTLTPPRPAPPGWWPCWTGAPLCTTSSPWPCWARWTRRPTRAAWPPSPAAAPRATTRGRRACWRCRRAAALCVCTTWAGRPAAWTRCASCRRTRPRWWVGRQGWPGHSSYCCSQGGRIAQGGQAACRDATHI